MPEQRAIMRAIRNCLNEINVLPYEITEGWKAAWTDVVLTKLCEIGRNGFGCKVGANPRYVCREQRDYGEWLYDLTWLKYNNERDEHLIDVPLVAESEWSGNFDKVKDDFHKLLLARASVRLMIYPFYALPGGERNCQTVRDIAERLAESVRKFGYRQEEDAWLLAGGVWRPGQDSPQGVLSDWCRYFTIDRNGNVVDFPGGDDA